ncbi:hypothetical protein BCR42DRAFT_403191 [Absidia repens]|uniref:Nudix hydrolase domain-containing protein n=1 Tax=Absidia repens TaxID=90262 RepID=A0A1X2IZ51_9FUNG|nr:hypothetical protein BCR42DRAFT_403191 [Absidia repens]
MTITSQQHLYRSVASIMVRRPPLTSNNNLSANYLFEDPMHSFSRHKDSSLYLLVKKPRKENAWQLPQGGVDPGETIAQGALRELEEECGLDIKVKLVETTPSCYYQYQFPEAFVAKHKRKHIGAKVQRVRVKVSDIDLLITILNTLYI